MIRLGPDGYLGLTGVLKDAEVWGCVWGSTKPGVTAWGGTGAVTELGKAWLRGPPEGEGRLP